MALIDPQVDGSDAAGPEPARKLAGSSCHLTMVQTLSRVPGHVQGFLRNQNRERLSGTRYSFTSFGCPGVAP